jgi:hypothetical protein
MAKKIIIGVVVLLIVVAGGAYYLYSNLGPILKAAIEKYGSEATQTKVTVDTVKLSLSDGQGSISGLVVGNPSGFNGPKSIDLGSISLQVDTGTVTQNPVVIKQIVIAAPQVMYERSGSGGNLEKIQSNVTQYAGADRAKSGGDSKPSSTSSSSSSSSSPSSSTADKKAERKVIIEDLQVRDGKVSISATQLPGRTLSANLPAIHLQNIGKDKGGATPAEVAEKVLGAITSEASKVAVADLQKSLGNLGGAVQDQLKNVSPGVQDQLKGLLGK